ncbi:hypothetical protein BGZ57DRAFT_901583 [Hyaloscypha finlandica]|nr:hypothetical protein F5882DRAFT_416675 [Hyaloscypha sp. PMI_1271]KAH8765675.1 hypothetical protein BGZ57DRAFT_901583 [Hyaloscypha finlandica]
MLHRGPWIIHGGLFLEAPTLTKAREMEMHWKVTRTSVPNVEIGIELMERDGSPVLPMSQRLRSSTKVLTKHSDTWLWPHLPFSPWLLQSMPLQYISI